MASICLAMIVKDESHVIERALLSIKPHIQHWVICDTGSHDDTMQIIERTLADIPGELTRAAWVDFAHNRNIVLERALKSGCDYVFSLDADEWLVVYDEDWPDGLDKDAYAILHRFGGNAFPTIRMVSTRLPWHWVGALHEVLECDDMPVIHPLDGVSMTTDNDGARSRDPEEGAKDLAILMRMIERDPEDTRAMFMIAITYNSMGENDKALEWFRTRSQHQEGNQEERWFANYRAGLILMQQEKPAEAMARLHAAYSLNPKRAEPLFWHGMIYFNRCDYGGALPYFELVAIKPKPVAMFVEEQMYDFGGMAMAAMCCALSGHREEAKAIRTQLAQEGLATEDDLAAIDEAIDIAL